MTTEYGVPAPITLCCTSSHDNSKGPPSHASPAMGSTYSCTTPSSSVTLRGTRNPLGYTTMLFQPRYQSSPRLSIGRHACTAMLTCMSAVNSRPAAADICLSASNCAARPRNRSRSSGTNRVTNGSDAQVSVQSASGIATDVALVQRVNSVRIVELCRNDLLH